MAVKRLAFAGLHLDDRVVEHGDAAQELHVEVPHVDGPPAGLADQGVALDQQLRQRLAALRPIAERQAPLAKLLVVELEHFRLQGVDPGHQRSPARKPPAGRPGRHARQAHLKGLENAAHASSPRGR